MSDIILQTLVKLCLENIAAISDLHNLTEKNTDWITEKENARLNYWSSFWQKQNSYYIQNKYSPSKHAIYD